MNPILLVTLIRSLGAIHAAVGMAEVAGPGDGTVLVALLVGAFVFRRGRNLDRLAPRDAFVRGYLVPVLAPAMLRVLAVDPGAWGTAGVILYRHLRSVITATPASVYLVVAGWSCFEAARSPRT